MSKESIQTFYALADFMLFMSVLGADKPRSIDQRENDERDFVRAMWKGGFREEIANTTRGPNGIECASYPHTSYEVWRRYYGIDD